MIELPELLKELSDLVGLQMALRLAEAKGGQQVYIPHKVSEGHWLADLVGIENARAICAYLTVDAGVHVTIPKGEALTRARRVASVAKMIDQGMSSNQIAAAANITQRHVFRQKAALKGRLHNQQPSLFDLLGETEKKR